MSHQEFLDRLDREIVKVQDEGYADYDNIAVLIEFASYLRGTYLGPDSLTEDIIKLMRLQ